MYQSRSALSINKCCPSPGSKGVANPLSGVPVALVFVLGVLESSPMGVMAPLGGTGILISSGDGGMIFS